MAQDSVQVDPTHQGVFANSRREAPRRSANSRTEGRVADHSESRLSLLGASPSGDEMKGEIALIPMELNQPLLTRAPSRPGSPCQHVGEDGLLSERLWWIGHAKESFWRRISCSRYRPRVQPWAFCR